MKPALRRILTILALTTPFYAYADAMDGLYVLGYMFIAIILIIIVLPVLIILKVKRRSENSESLSIFIYLISGGYTILFTIFPLPNIIGEDLEGEIILMWLSYLYCIAVLVLTLRNDLKQRKKV